LKFLSEIRTLVPFANIMGSKKEFMLKRGNLYILQPIKAPGLTPGEPHSQKKILGCIM